MCEQIASEEGSPAGGEKKSGRSFSLTFILFRSRDSQRHWICHLRQYQGIHQDTNAHAVSATTIC
jgi:hypothetical protein